MNNSNVDEDRVDQDARTIYCANLSDKVTEDILYELFLQAGPVERISLPKDKDGIQKSFGFITYKHQASVPYALAVYSGTKLFNRELRLNNRSSSNTSRPLEPQPIMPNIGPMHQFQIDSSALRAGGFNSPLANDLLPRALSNHSPHPINAAIDVNSLLQFSSQMLHSSIGNDPTDKQYDHQSKILHRHEHRSHHQNSNYSRRDDRNDRDNRRRERDRERERDRDQARDRDRDRGDDWIRNGREKGRHESKRRNDRRFF